MIPEPDEDGSLWEDPHEPTARPGSHAPHFVLEDGRSTLDLCGRGFVVLTGPNGTGTEEIEEHRIDDPAFAEAYGIGPAGAVLVRPDGFVAWRTQEASVEGLRSALSKVRQSGAR